VSTGAIPLAKFRYREPPPDGRDAKHLVPAPGLPDAPQFTFHGRLEIGRDDGVRPMGPGLLLISDPIVSRQHCMISQHASGRCFVRDVSRNGTRIDGRRLMPNVETPFRLGQVLSVGNHDFVLRGEEAAQSAAVTEPPIGTSTIPQADRRIVTVLIGDIRDYTVLSRRELSEEVQRSVSRVFEVLGGAVTDQGGSVKEFQGDAILAYWEGDVSGKQAPRACQAALALDGLARRIAHDRSIWALHDFPLAVDWAMCTGLVLIDSIGDGAGRHGGGQRAGLSMMGEPVVRAFRIEKFANDATGRILACNMTRDFAAETFDFRDLGLMQAKGFDKPDRVFALVGARGATG
jgi:adenylate cyclase